MGVFDMFKTADPAPAPATPAQGATPVVSGEPGNIQQPTVQADPNNHTAPIIPEQEVPTSPLDNYKEFWEAPVADPNAPTPTTSAPLTAEAVSKVVANQDFSKLVSPEQLTAITAGGEEASAAFTAAMGAVAQQVMTQSILVNHKLTEQAVAKATAKSAADLPELIRKNDATNNLQNANPLFSNPAIKPIMDAAQEQFRIKNPSATPTEVTGMTQDYVTALGEVFNPAKVITDPMTPETDFSTFLEK